VLFSRYVVGSACSVQQLTHRTCVRQGVEPEMLALHQDRSSPIASESLAELLRTRCEQDFSRPRVSNDNEAGHPRRCPACLLAR